MNKRKKIGDVIESIHISKYPLDEINKEIQKLDRMSINKIEEILNELAVFDKLAIGSRKIKLFKKAYEGEASIKCILIRRKDGRLY